MMKFKKYNSIENSYQKKVIEQIYFHGFNNHIFVVQEKVHGANFSFITDGNEILCAKRSGFLAKDEQFYNYQYVLKNHKERILKLFKKVKKIYKNIETISIFGELFGGFYPHDKVAQAANMTMVQKGIHYCPENDFYAFDILVNTETYLDVETCNKLFEETGFFYAKTLKKGTLKTVLKYPNLFISNIPKWKGLPTIKNNTCEGIIIRPETPLVFGNGSRVILKNKNEKWAEKVKKQKVERIDMPLTEDARNAWNNLECFITSNRLKNVLGKEGEFEAKMIGKLIGLMAQDVLQDFLKEHAEIWESIDKTEQKKLKKMMNNSIVALIKKGLMGI
ncbi:MAG: RNA ligase, Rnl2 family [Chitinophagales bacterium]|nr:RNA ligase, Rnl2 family [Chitinophagales bacterium]